MQIATPVGESPIIVGHCTGCGGAIVAALDRDAGRLPFKINSCRLCSPKCEFFATKDEWEKAGIPTADIGAK